MTGHSKLLHPLHDERLREHDITLPFVTVIVTSYNYEKYILQCLQSIAKQNYPHFKCVVVDDCSTDNSIQVIKEFISSRKEGPAFSLVRHDTNAGQMAAFKTGLQHAEGVLVSFVDADDILFNDFLTTHIEAHMGPHPYSFTSSNQYQINDKNEILAGTHPDLQSRGRFRTVRSRSLHDPFWLWATTSSMMFRKSILDLILPKNTRDFRICADNYVCHFANLIGGSLLIPTVHGSYRRHGENGFSRNPFVGGQLPTGNMSHHPKHRIVRQAILAHFLENHKQFEALLSADLFTLILLRLISPLDIVRHYRFFTGYLDDKPRLFSLRIFLISFLLRLKMTVHKSWSIVRYVLFYKDKRSNSDI